LPTIDRQASQRLKIFNGKFDNKGASATAPAIALDAARQSITVDLDKPFPATVAPHQRLFLITLAFCRDDLSRTAKRQVP
jgi:hypothetical protein